MTNECSLTNQIILTCQHHSKSYSCCIRTLSNIYDIHLAYYHYQYDCRYIFIRMTFHTNILGINTIVYILTGLSAITIKAKHSENETSTTQNSDHKGIMFYQPNCFQMNFMNLHVPFFILALFKIILKSK